MERTYLQWNLVNWITVVLMATLGAMLVGLIAASIKTYGPKSAE
jgi:hypothetical protein